ncbi:hypothetical protein AcV5_007300 [Taiwanofungus camphoratus]|nr:hypothetical protein AcV5_007300 [Antrodia cinnamomea]
MMFRAFLALTFALSALATPGGSDGGSNPSQCDSGTILCCDNVAPASCDTVKPMLSALKIQVDDDSTPIGTGCGSGGLLGIGGGSSCTNTPVCCQDNYFGLIGIGCTSIPINI